MPKRATKPEDRADCFITTRMTTSLRDRIDAMVELEQATYAYLRRDGDAARSRSEYIARAVELVLATHERVYRAIPPAADRYLGPVELDAAARRKMGIPATARAGVAP